ncbi:tetratricopeptide (TPR) repeat protein [Novosphingobium hassiacum]|uniref:Tetratricopeptide (TPR) repeat protein n=1 Tax=Novosphingobium hassiacum TaxID=173676 RepID=A0A7W6A146_9SPHN|nr:SPOR domain-containing protein [Novosphingobium hassiacum]MBB3861345.1 tetratricopeptide (TPR) repeat protein [Novosphingobium hassiacum]
MSRMKFMHGTALSLALAIAAPAVAQVDDDPDGPTTISRPVVQSTAPSPSRELNAALARLASDPRNVPALTDAADAALKLGDSDAAIGFLSRANEAQPNNTRSKVLLGKAYLVAENPVDAIRAFDDAERAGADTFAMAGDRALAYDLVGDNARAQRWYQVAASRGGDDELTRRHALSLAISGDRRGAEALIAPLIAKQDRATWRTRTFVMAVTGGPDEAVAVAYASMPQELASSIAPYLRYMPRLTPAQQAAAANFGRFPRAADIGRDDARIAQYAALNPRSPRYAEASLTPTGAPLGPNSDKPSREKRRRPGKEQVKVAASASLQPGRIPTPSITQPTATALPPSPTTRYVAATTTSTPTPNPVPAQAARPTVLSALDVPPGTTRPPVGPIRRTTTPTTTAPSSATAIPSVPTRYASAQPVVQPLPSTVRPATSAPTTTTALTAPSYTPLTSTPALATPRPGTTATTAAPIATAPTTATASAPATPSIALPDTKSSGAAAVSPAASGSSFDLARLAPSSTAQPLPQTTSPAANPVTSPPSPAPTQIASAQGISTGSASVPESTATPDKPADFVSLFKSFAPPAEERQPAVAAVDITRLPPKPVIKSDPRGERPDAPSDVSRTAAKEPPAKIAATAKAAAKTAQDAKDAKAKKAAPSHPSRIWVQVLTGANKDMMDNEWRRLVKEAPEVLRGRKPYMSPWRSNFRLLTGPFESEASAQDIIAKLRKSGVSSYQWTSPAGQAVDTLALK